MIKIKREMQKTETIETNHHYTQVAFNSDGCLTVRKYDMYNKDKDEIIIFSQNETREIVKLFRQFNSLCNSRTDDLPF